MSTTDRTLPVPDNPAADAGTRPHEPLPDDAPVLVPPASGEANVPTAASASALSDDRQDTIANTPEPDVMSEFRCIAAAAPEPGWTGQGFDVFAPPPTRVQPDEQTEQAVESPAPEPAPSEPDPVATSREPDLEAEVVAAVEPQWEEPEPAVDTVMVLEPEPEPAADPPEAVQPPVDTEPPTAIEEPEPVIDTLALVERELAAPSPETAQPAVDTEPPAAIEEPEPVVDLALVEPELAALSHEAAQPAVDTEPPAEIEEPEPVGDAPALVEPEPAALSPETAQPAVDTEPRAAIEAALNPTIADVLQTPVAPKPLPAPAREPEPAWTLQGPTGMSAITTPVPAAAERRWTRDELKAVGVRAAKVAGIVFTAWFCTVLFLIVVYRFINPPVSSLMVLRWLSGTKIERDWVPLARISPNLRRAVIVSEDGRFCSHWGIDFAEVAAAIKRTPRGVPRGASTITMQVAKNLFLWPAKSYVRKVVEVPLTYAIEMLWPKRRILEVYLNVAEWGPGIFGAEAAARAHFGQSAGSLGARQSAQLAVSLPNPILRDAGSPGPRAARRASVIQRRALSMRSASSCVDTAR